jgi:hypothetical protein
VLQVVIANRLSDGVVVFLGPDARWAEQIDDAEIARSDEDGARLEAAARASEARDEVVDPYLIDITDGPDGIQPTRYRERIRAQGPSVRADLGKQAER